MAVERFPVEAGHILMFARSIGDANPVYGDAAYAAGTEVGGIPAPPTFVQASAQFDEDYPLRPKVGQPWFGSGKEPSGIRRGGGSGSGGGGGGSGGGGGGTGLHAEQHYTYHRPLLAGAVLTAETRAGERWEKQGKRAGKLVFSEMITEYRDEAGELVVTARGVAVRTEKVVGELMALKASELTEGQTFTTVVVEDLKRTQIVQYAGVSGDYNPLHTDEVFATQVAGYPSVFAHGMLTMGMTGRMVTDLVGDGRLASFGGRFTSQVFPGDDLTTTATVGEIRDEDGTPVVELALRTVNQDDREVFSGYATARVDP